MIYLILTASIHDHFGKQDPQKRQEQYSHAITKTLQHLPASITPIIVENNGARATYLDHFTHAGKSVPVIYTTNNTVQYRTKGVNEFLDLKEVIQRVGMKESDMIIKLTGRYRATSPHMFEQVIANESTYDAFVKFYGVDSLQMETYDCVLGCFALRVNYLLLFRPFSMNMNRTPEHVFAKYVRFCGGRLKEIDKLDVECIFADNFRKLLV